ncbi:efflux pump antibiotic resistance [Trichoderma cornu-damae]|uniref:Efflux pump antibiotic resistance n=1 Tax=Trichoderma cornu-damae TaxID=654480 RepID=A0A9P8QJ26_9HYPO|nr:efflux pump antibiotic resistance [Trichoderma cornu-damae]
MKKPTGDPPRNEGRAYRLDDFSFVSFSDLELFPASQAEGWYQSASSTEELSAPPPIWLANTRTAKSLPNGYRSPPSVRHEAIMGHDLHGLSDSEVPLGALNHEPKEPTEEGDYLTGFKLWLMLVSLIFSIFLIALDLTIVATSIPAITNQFHGLEDQAWYSAIYLMTSGGFQSTWGKMYQYFPLKIGFLSAMAVFEIGSLICGVAPSSASFIVGRTIAGIGAAGVSSGAYTICAYISDPKKRAAHTGILGAVFGIGSILGPLLGGVFSTESTWRWCFYINLPIGVLPIPREAPLKEKMLQLDPLGTGILMGAIITYLMAVHYGGQIDPWSSARVVGLLVASIVLFIIFAFVELWQDERAMIIPRLFAKRDIGVALFYTLFQGGALFAMVYYLPLYFQAIRGTDAVISGVHNLPFIIAAMASALAAGMFISNTGLATPVMVGGSAIATLGCGLCHLFDLDTGTGVWVGIQIVVGLGLGCAFQVPIMVGQVSVDVSDIAAATAMILCFQTVGGAIWVSASQSIFVNRMLIAVPHFAPGVDPAQVVNTGAGELREAFGPDQIAGVLTAYLAGIRAAYVLSCAVVGTSLLIGVFLPWKRLDTDALKEAGGAAA